MSRGESADMHVLFFFKQDREELIAVDVGISPCMSINPVGCASISCLPKAGVEGGQEFFGTSSMTE